MRTRVERSTVDLSAYPDLVVIYLGMRVNRIAGIKTLLGQKVLPPLPVRVRTRPRQKQVCITPVLAHANMHWK